MKKKILALCLVVVLAVTAITGVTLAYFTDTDDATNTFTIGNVDIFLTEPNWEASGKEEAKDVYPGEALKKDPTVTNIGVNPCFVRIKVTGLAQLGEGNLIKYRTNYVLDALGEDWVYNETDEYFYYAKVLASGEKTSPVFDSIVIPATITNDQTADKDADGNDIDEQYNVVVNAEAVQAQGIRPNWSTNATNGEGIADMGEDDVEEIARWFTTCMAG